MTDQSTINECAGLRRLHKDKLLVQIPGEPDQKWLAHMKAKFPGMEVRWEQLFWKPGDSVEAGSIDLPAQVWDGITIACLFLPHTSHLMSTVRYVQLTSAGYDKWVNHQTYKDPNVTICTASGIHAPQISEWVVGTWLMMRNGYLAYAATQRQAQWSRSLVDVRDTPGLRMGILGYGAIGSQCGRLASAMGVEVYAFTRSPRSDPAQRQIHTYSLPGMGDPDGSIPSAWFHGTTENAINNFLAQDLDILVLSVPLTDSTRHMIAAKQFDILAKKKTFLSNVARGPLVVTDDLVEALHRGKIQGAALDVTDPEPLPDGHPLYTAPNVFITPHISYRTKSHFQRVLAILEANLEQLEKGGPLLNTVQMP